MRGSSASNASASTRLRFGDCEIRQQTHELWRQGQPQPIRRKAFDVLLLLIDQRPRTLDHKQIARAVWGSKANAAKQVARAVMDARREIGDDAQSPKYLLSVRGVGYRFAADVSLAVVDEATQLDETDEADVGAHSARADIDAAAACMRRAELGEAQRLVDRAIASADLAGARPELARALALGASVMLRLGSREHALTLATKAMRMAQIEGRSDVLAEVRLGLAEVQLWMGSAHAALDHLQAAHRVLSPQGPSLALWRCERVLSDAYREIGRPDDAWPWCERAEASALLLEPETRAIRERLLKVAVLHAMVEAADADGREDDLRTHGIRSLEILDAVEPDILAIGSRSFELACRTYRAVSLEQLGRLDEAWSVIEQLRPILFGSDLEPSAMLEMRRTEFRLVEASLMSRLGRAAEAIQAVEASIALATQGPDSSMELAFDQGLAAKICERAGRYKEAAEWLRRQLRTTTRLHTDRAQATAGIVRAQLESDRLAEDLAQARAEVQRLTQLNLELERRIVQMDRHPLLDEGGLVPAAALAATIEARAAVARERELPLCIGIVESSAPPDEDGAGGDRALRRRLKRLSSTLKAVIPEASAAAQWRPGVYFFVISDMGLGPARERCQMLALRMNADVVPSTIPEPTVNYRADAVDVTRFSGIEVALGQLPGMKQHAARVDFA